MRSLSVVEARAVDPALVAERQASKPLTVCRGLCRALAGMGVESAFGLVGGAIAPLAEALADAGLSIFHARHEGGAGFAAIEASLSSGRPAILFATTGPGLTNALTGIAAARWEGAKVLLLSGMTSPAQRGRWACQETSALTLPLSGIFTSGPLFHFAAVLDHPGQLPQILVRLADGFSRPDGFVAHLAIPLAVQTEPLPSLPRLPHVFSEAPACSDKQLRGIAELLHSGPAAIWAGFGARHASAELRAVAERLGAPVMCSPRAKGVFPESHPLYLGTTGLGGQAWVEEYLTRHRPAWTLVLGTRLSEPTSFWSQALVPSQGFIHVDLDRDVPGAAFPNARTIAVHAEVRAFLGGLHEVLGNGRGAAVRDVRGPPPPLSMPRGFGRIRPPLLMAALQRIVVDGSDAVVMTESGNAFAWGNHHLRFDSPRYRVSTGFGSMGHAAAGVVGLALARKGKAVALVGDGSMLMASEVSTAVRYRAEAVWVVMNDARYNMVEQGMRALGFDPVETEIPPTDFVALARALGADGTHVREEGELDAALQDAMVAPGPFVVDVQIDPDEPAPWMKRIQNLILQGADARKEGA